MEYGYYANGWLQTKDLGDDDVSYDYDALGRISRVFDPFGANHERYRYDLASNPEIMDRARTVLPSESWAYPSGVNFNEIPYRTALHDPLNTEQFSYDTVGRLTQWMSPHLDQPGLGPVDVTRDYAYDGAGRLRHVHRSWAGNTQWMTSDVWYDSDNQLVHEMRDISGTLEETWRFDGWQEDSGTAMVIESVLPMVRLENGALRVVYTESDGRALWTSDVGGALTQSVVGAYGLPIESLSLGPTWKLDGLHGAEVDARQEVIHYGTRHLAMRDGLWLQPEPLLHFGITNGTLQRPLGFSGLYAAGNTNQLFDTTGYDPLLLAKAIVGGDRDAGTVRQRHPVDHHQSRLRRERRDGLRRSWGRHRKLGRSRPRGFCDGLGWSECNARGGGSRRVEGGGRDR